MDFWLMITYYRVNNVFIKRVMAALVSVVMDNRTLSLLPLLLGVVLLVAWLAKYCGVVHCLTFDRMVIKLLFLSPMLQVISHADRQETSPNVFIVPCKVALTWYELPRYFMISEVNGFFGIIIIAKIIFMNCNFQLALRLFEDDILTFLYINVYSSIHLPRWGWHADLPQLIHFHRVLWTFSDYRCIDLEKWRWHCLLVLH